VARLLKLLQTLSPVTY